MRQMTKFLMVAVCTLLMVSVSQAANEQEQATYYEAIGAEYGVHLTEIEILVKTGLADQELPVAFFIAKETKGKAHDLAVLRSHGNSWADILSKRAIRNDAFYLMIAKKVESNIFGPILQRFKIIPQEQWNRIEWTDKELINMVNLKFLASYHDYSVFKIIDARDNGATYVTINTIAMTAKNKMAKDAKLKLLEEAKKKQEEADKDEEEEEEDKSGE